MSYAKLYEHCQAQRIPVGRKVVADFLFDVLQLPRARLWADGLNTQRVRGYYLSGKNTNHRFIQQNGGLPVVVFARDLDDSWARFVIVKELMHLFDDPLHSLGSPPEFDALLTEFTSGLPHRSAAMESEINSFWMALGCLCPEGMRQEMQQARGVTLSDADIAAQLLIPTQYVPNLFTPNFKNIISELIA